MKKLKYIAVFLLVFFAAIIGFIAEQPTAAEAGTRRSTKLRSQSGRNEL